MPYILGGNPCKNSNFLISNFKFFRKTFQICFLVSSRNLSKKGTRRSKFIARDLVKLLACRAALALLSGRLERGGSHCRWSPGEPLGNSLLCRSRYPLNEGTAKRDERASWRLSVASVLLFIYLSLISFKLGHVLPAREVGGYRKWLFLHL